MKIFFQLFMLLVYFTASLNFSFIQNTQYMQPFLLITVLVMTIGVLWISEQIYNIIDYYSKDSE